MGLRNLDKRLSACEQVLAKVAAGNLDQRVTVATEDDALAHLEMGINFLLMDLRASEKSNRGKTDTLQQQKAELQQQLELIGNQSRALIELSTPVLELWDGVVAVPLIGTIDTARAQQLLENLLNAINRVHAAVVIIDITGVPIVDNPVANHFIKTVQACRMLGSEVILTGVSPPIAQTLVKLGVDLADLETRGSLQAGISHALALTGTAVVTAKSAAETPS
jgi:anti-anti-sigma regulatory factor